MTEYSVALEWRSSSPNESFDEDLLDVFNEQLADYEPAISFGTESYRARIAISGNDPLDALAKSSSLGEEARANAGSRNGT